MAVRLEYPFKAGFPSNSPCYPGAVLDISYMPSPNKLRRSNTPFRGPSASHDDGRGISLDVGPVSTQTVPCPENLEWLHAQHRRLAGVRKHHSHTWHVYGHYAATLLLLSTKHFRKCRYGLDSNKQSEAYIFRSITVSTGFT